MSARATSLTLPSSQAGKVLVAVLFAVLTGLASRVVVYLPGSPVPFTLQVLPVLLSGLLLGWRLARRYPRSGYVRTRCPIGLAPR